MMDHILVCPQDRGALWDGFEVIREEGAIEANGQWFGVSAIIGHKPHCSAGYVLGGAEPMTQMVFRRVFKHIKKNVELFGATPHIFRHTYITTLAKANVDLKTIQRISGHANITTTLNIYTHTREEEIQEAGDKIGELLGK